ncbi:MAG: hypothetical protein IJ829_02825 [Kiritimatiellae bacterium]|nr:hypothetical protein [Kiritimatiellia bacterium]
MKKAIAAALASCLASALCAATSAIKVNLRMDDLDYVAGERVRAVVDIANSSPESVSVGYSNSKDKLFVEVYRSSDGLVQLDEAVVSPFVSRFRIDSNEGQKLETFLGDHYRLRADGKYLAKPVLVHGGLRYEGQLRAFSVVPGMKVGAALQMFKNREGLRREFELLSWSRKGVEHLFLAARDEGAAVRAWRTTDLGPMLRLGKPTISVLPSGEVIVLHRLDRDHFLRTEFWSLPDALEFHRREVVQDPETAGSERVKELYKESGGVKPKEEPWWKFW